MPKASSPGPRSTPSPTSSPSRSAATESAPCWPAWRASSRSAARWARRAGSRSTRSAVRSTASRRAPPRSCTATRCSTPSTPRRGRWARRPPRWRVSTPGSSRSGSPCARTRAARPTRTTSTPAWLTGGRPTTAPTTPGSPRSRPPTTRTACSTSPRRCEPAQQTGPQPELRARSNLSAWLRAGVVVRLADELRITERVELVRPVLRVLAEGVPGGHVAEQDEAGAARVVDTPVRVEMAWPRRRHGTAAQGAGTVRLGAAGDLAQREVGLEVELGVLLAVRRGEQFQETPWVYVRRTAGGPFRPVRGPVEVEVAVLEHVVQAARQPVRRRR